MVAATSRLQKVSRNGLDEGQAIGQPAWPGRRVHSWRVSQGQDDFPGRRAVAAKPCQHVIAGGIFCC